MKFCMVVASSLVLLSSLSCFAEPAGPPRRPAREEMGQGVSPERFAQHKQELLQRMQQRKATMDQAIACVQGAQTPEALRRCREQLHQGQQAR